MISILGLTDVINRHEAQGEATVGERGNRLSGGEKQRISLARALLKKPHLLLLDEATTALDEVNRKTALAAIETLQKDNSSVFVTHDLSLIKPLSQVLFLCSPDVAYHGTHDELLENYPSYRQFIEGIEREN